MRGRDVGVEGHRCVTCGGQVPTTMPACPVCEPGVVLSTGPPVKARVVSSSRGRVALRPALEVLRRRPVLLVPPLLAVGATVGVAIRLLSRVDLAFFWLFEIVAQLTILAVAGAVGFTALTLARAVTVAVAVHHWRGVDRPLNAALGQVVRRPGSVLLWVVLHGIVGAVHGLALLVRSAGESSATLRYEPGAASLKNSQYVWQVMLGEDAGVARSMDRSAALVRAGLAGSRPLSMVAMAIAVVAMLAGGLLLVGGGLRSATVVPWTVIAVVVTVTLAVWAALADVLDTAAWWLATRGGAPAPFGSWQLGGDLDLPPTGA